MERAAKCLATKGYLGDIYGEGSGLSAHIPPGYPTLLAATYLAFGDSVPRKIAQAVLTSLVSASGIALLPVATAGAGIGRTPGLVAASMLAVFPISPWMEIIGDWEGHVTGTLLVLELVLYQRLSSDDAATNLDSLSAAVVTAFGATVSPMALSVPIAWVVVNATRSRRSLGAFLKRSLVILLPTLILMVAWGLRNSVGLGAFMPTRSNLGLELHMGNNPNADGNTADEKSDIALRNLHPNHSRRQRDRYGELGEVAYYREAGEQALAWISRNPIDFLLLTVNRIRLMLFPDPKSFARTRFPVVFAAYIYLTSVGCLLGFISFRKRSPMANLWLFSLLTYAIPYSLTHVSLRYRFPIQNIFTVMTVVLVFDFIAARFARRNPGPSRT